MNNGLLYLGGLLVMVLAALFAVPFFIDWNGYRGVFEEEASKVLGRDVRVGGGVNLRLLPTPYVRFEKVRLSDTTGQTGEPFVRADSFTMWLSGPALLRGVLEAKEVELSKPVLSLVLDSQGGGNWGSLKLKPGALPFVPQDVALRSVKMIDGTIALYGAQSEQIGRIESLNGELSADAIAGPFKFKGVGKWSGEVREIKFATTEADAGGAYHIKANLRSLASATNYSVDGKLEDLSGQPKFDGEFGARFAMPELDAPSQGAGKGNEVKDAKDGTGIEMKAKLTGNALGAKLDDINISFENAAEPQVITGTASAAWAGEPRMDTMLSAKWLDLDRLTGAGASGASFQRIEQLGLGLFRSLAGAGAAGAKIAIEQVKIGGETTGGLTIDAERRGGAVTLKDLRAGLPGGSRLELSGQLKDDGASGTFDGQVLLHGANIARLLQWAAKSGSGLDIKAEGPFSAEGRLAAGDKSFEFTDAKAEIAGQPFMGDIRISNEGRRRIAFTVEGSRLDTAQLFPTKAREIENEIRMALGLAKLPGSEPSSAGGTSAAEGQSDVSVRLLAGELKTGTRVFRNVDATLAFDGGEFRVPQARFVSASGLGVTFEARIKNAAQEPKGTLNCEFDAATPEAMKDMAAMTGLGEIFPIERFEVLGSARLSGLVRLGERGKGSADMTFGGTVKTARVSGRAEFDGGLSAWRSAPSRISAMASAPDLVPILLALGAEAPRAGASGTRPSTVTMASSGTLATGAMSLVEIKAEGLETAFNGKVVWPEAVAIALDGTLNVKAGELMDVLRLTSMPTPGGLDGTGLDGSIAIAKKDGVLTLSSRQLMVGATRLRGQASVKRAASGNSQVSADIAAGEVKVASLLSGVLEHASVAPQAAGTAAGAGHRSVWPEALFNLDALKSIEGDVRLAFAALEVEPGLTARNGAMKIALKPGKISISDLSGEAAGGKISGATDFEKSPAGVTFAGNLRLDGAALTALSRQAKGRAGFDIAVTGRAQSPAAVMAQLAGKGSISLEGTSHPGPAAGDVAQAGDLVLSGKLQNEPDPIRDVLALALSKSVAESGTRTIPIAIVDGALRADPFVIESKDGKTTVTTTVDLASLSVDSAWQIAALAPPQQKPADAGPEWMPTVKGPLPPVSFIYVGKLADIAHIGVKVDPGELQRELTVRQMERNVEELERLRRKEDERIKQELDRRKALEAQKAAAVAAAAAAKAAPPAPAPVPAASAAPPELEKLPPILPDSNGTAGTVTIEAVPPAPAAGGNAKEYNTQAGSPDSAAQSPSTAAAPKPIPGTEPGPGQPKQVDVLPDAAAGLDGNKVVPRPAPAASPRPRAARGRSAADEMTRALGATP